MRPSFLLLCFTASPPFRYHSILAFKSTSIQPFISGCGGGGGCNTSYKYRRQWHSRSRSHITIRQKSPCTLQLAAEDDAEESSSSSSPSTPTTTSISDGVERRLSAASTKKTEILVANDKPSESDTTLRPQPSSKAATSTVNERLLSEIQASVEKEKYGEGKKREYFNEFRSQKTEEERQRSIEEARDLNGK